jgi:ketosteroid isomerase-like protein
MLKSLILLLVTLVCVFPVAAQSSDGSLQSELEAVHEKWFKAFDTGDGATMDKVEVPNLILILPNGQIWPKDGPRAGSQPKGDVTAQRSLSKVAVRQFGDVAILTGVVTTKGTQDNGQMGTTVVFVRSSGAWKIASAQWSPGASSK